MSSNIAPQRVTSQPTSLNAMVMYHDEKNAKPPGYTEHVYQSPSFSSHQDGGDCSHSASPCHDSCHRSRLRRMLIPALLSLLAIATIIFIACLDDLNIFGSGDGIMGMGKRATNSGGNNSTLVNKKRAYLCILPHVRWCSRILLLQFTSSLYLLDSCW